MRWGLAEERRHTGGLAAVATSVAMLRATYYVDCRQCRRCRHRTVTAFEALRLTVPSVECLAYWYGVAVLRLIDRRCQQAASGSLLDMLTLPSHHRAAAFYVVRAVVPDSLTR